MELKGRLSHLAGVQLGRLALAAWRRPFLTLAITGLATVLAVVAASRLRVDTDLTNLLPRHFESVKGLEALEERFYGVGYLVVVGIGGTDEQLGAFAEDVAPRLEALDRIRYVDFKRPLDWVEARALYFVDVPDLQSAYDRLKARYDAERQRRNPMYFELEESEPPAVDFSDLEAKYAARKANSWMVGGGGASDYYIDHQNRMVMLLGKPTQRAINMEFSAQVVADAQAMLREMDLSKYGPDFRVALTGSYKKKIDQQAQIIADLRLASGLALLLMLGYLGVHFRRLSAVGLVVIPLLTGLIWTFGAAELAFGQLNLLTGFIGAILLGIGIDHGIHLTGRLAAEHTGDFDPEVAIERTFGQTGNAVAMAAVTTTMAFAGIAISDFRAFREFGAVAAAGSILVVVAYTTVLPALLGLRPKARAASGGSGRGSSFARTLPNISGRILGISLPIAIALTALVPQVEFDLDFRSLEDGNLPSFVLDRRTDRILGYNQSPAIVLTHTAEQERATIEAFRAAQAAGEADSVDFVAGVSDMLPQQQAEKQAILKRLGKLLKKIKPSWLDTDEQREGLARLRPMTQTPTFGRADLPVEIRRQFQGPEATPDEGFVLVFPSGDLADGADVLRFATEVRAVGARVAGTAPAAGEAMVLADLMELITGEAPVVVGFTGSLVALTLWLLMGNLRTALICLTPALLTVICLLGLLVLTPVHLNFLNIVMLPVLVGIGVDAGVHLVLRIDESEDFGEAFGETARSISGAILTTGLGFGALVLADHPGLQSLGKLALLGLSMNLVVAVIVFGAWLAHHDPRTGEAT